MSRVNMVLATAFAIVLRAPPLSGQATSPELIRMTTPALDVPAIGVRGGTPVAGSVGAYNGGSGEAVHRSAIDFNERLGISAAADDRRIEPFLLIGAAAGGLAGYAFGRTRTGSSNDSWISDEAAHAFGAICGATLGVGIGAIAYFIGPRQPSDREPPTPQPPTVQSAGQGAP